MRRRFPPGCWIRDRNRAHRGFQLGRQPKPSIAMTLFLFVDAHLPIWLRPRPPRTDRATMLGPKDNAIEEPLRVAASEAYPGNFTRLRPSAQGLPARRGGHATASAR
jgi:hypothetical protein